MRKLQLNVQRFSSKEKKEAHEKEGNPSETAIAAI